MTGPDPAGGTTLDVFADVEHTPGFVDFARLAHPPLGVVPLAKIAVHSLEASPIGSEETL